MDLQLEKIEADVGDFSLDILAKDLGSNSAVVIENQLEATDHDHLGKLITYAAGYDAGCAIWIATDVRDEHREALEFLNRRSDSSTGFFLIRLEVIQIDDSKPALTFKLIVSPNDWQKLRQSSCRAESSEKAELYRKFFENLIRVLIERGVITGSRTASPVNWLSFSSGSPDFHYVVTFASKGRIRVEIYIDTEDAAVNKDLFDALRQCRLQIEKSVGTALVWERLDAKRACRISVVADGTINDDDDILEANTNWAAAWLAALKNVFGTGIREIIANIQPDPPIESAGAEESTG